MGKLTDSFNKFKKFTKKATSTTPYNNYFNYDTKENREGTIRYLFAEAKSARSAQETKWQKYEDYYNNEHDTQKQIQQTLEDANIPFIPAIIPEPYIHVESQIQPDVPSFEFKGRDDDQDSQKATQRANVVQFILDNNKIEKMNTKNERRLNKLGNACWKVAWNDDIKGYNFNGDITVSDVSVKNLFFDPTAETIEECEYIDYPYPMHKISAGRMFKKELKELGLSIHDIGTGLIDANIPRKNVEMDNNNTVQILEHWFRHPEDGSHTMEFEVNGKTVKQEIKYEAGDIGVVITINDIEIKYIPKYWLKTGMQNKRYPFIMYGKIPIEDQIYDRSEMENIIDLTDAIDREISYALLNTAFTANDILVVEEDVLADDSEDFTGTPGALVKVKQGKINGIKRLGGLANPTNRLEMVNFIRSIIQETVGNFDASQGKEPTRVTTASGIAQLNERADARKNIKKVDRLTGFEMLYELIDYTALEFYDDDRIIFIGAKDDKKEPIVFQYNSDNMAMKDSQGESYYPRVDTKITAGDGVRSSKAFTLAAVENLINKPVTLQNYKLVQGMVEIMDLPNRKEIIDYLETLFGAQLQQQQQQQINIQQNIPKLTLDEVMAELTPEEQQALEDDPSLLE